MKTNEKVEWMLERCKNLEIFLGIERWMEFYLDWELPGMLLKWSVKEKEDFIKAGLVNAIWTLMRIWSPMR
jgi:hypothetical protein